MKVARASLLFENPLAPRDFRGGYWHRFISAHNSLLVEDGTQRFLNEAHNRFLVEKSPSARSSLFEFSAVGLFIHTINCFSCQGFIYD